jgi:hypothetical protein
LRYCLYNRIIPFCLPSHATHDLQPLDVGVFGPYQLYYGQAVDEEVRLSHGVLNIGKHNFWYLLQQARVKTFISTTIASGWRKSGLVPFNPRIVYSQLPGEHTPEPSTRSRSSPISPTTPKTPRSARRLMRKVLKGTTSTPQKRYANKLSNTVEHLLVMNELIHHDLVEMKKALESKPKRNQKRLTGIGAIALEDLIRIKEELDRKEQEKANRKGKGRASKQATQSAESSIVVEDIVDDEEGSELDAIEVDM